ncbi:MAG: hypothetical protein ABIW76_24125 [Fibrobacteria bacterium]
MRLYSPASNSSYQRISYATEAEFEKDVVAQADRIFGPAGLYFDLKKRLKGKEIIGIPDGYLIDCSNADEPALFIIENEISTHDSFKHIGIQLLKFVVAFDDYKVELKANLISHLQENPGMMKRFEAFCANSKSRNIDSYMEAAVFGEFKGLVIIDEAGPELNKILEKIRADISILTFNKFVDPEGKILFSFDPFQEDEGEDAFGISIATISNPQSDHPQPGQSRKARADTIIVPAKEEGFQKVFLGQHKWHEIRISASMKPRIKFIAAYQSAPISAITHIAPVADISLYKDTGKYIITFAEPAKEFGPIHLRESRNKPQGPIYVEREKLLSSRTLEEALEK